MTWVGERRAHTATIWLTNPNQDIGVIEPPSATFQWRDQNGTWNTDTNVVFIFTGASPQYTMTLLFDAQVTGEPDDPPAGLRFREIPLPSSTTS